MRRKKDDKRVLIPRSSPKHVSNKSKKRFGRNQNSRNNRNNRISRNNRYYNDKPKKKRSKLTLFLMILALVGFVVGAGMGISLSFDNGDDGPHIENVTTEMTTNLNDTEPIVYDSDVDAVDYNSNQDVAEYNLTETAPSY